MILHSFIDALLRRWESEKGIRSISVVYRHQDPQESYRIATNKGDTIEIFCREAQYEIRYSAWWAWPKRLTLYKVYCRCSDNVPAVLQNLLLEDFTMQQLLHPWINREAQKKSVIDAFIEIVLAHLK